jgi:hypothetical protein
MAILDAVKAVQDAMITLTGIKTAADYPGPGVFPLVITHLGSGDIVPGNPTGARRELHNIVVELHVAQGGSDTDSFTVLETLHALVVPELCRDVTFAGSLQTYTNITYSTSRSSWDGAPTVARFYTLNQCKIIA